MNAALKILKDTYGYDGFRMVQQNIIDTFNNKNNTLGIMPTGGGKSVCYQIPALMREGLTIVISPLKSLMDDQTRNMKNVGITTSATLHSGTSIEDKEAIYDKIYNNELKMLLISPERAISTINLLKRKDVDISQYVFDEAHCLSQWGHNFRPDYKTAASKILEQNLPILALTATADNRTKEDLQTQLGVSPEHTFVSGFNRPNIHLSAVYKKSNGYEQIKKVILNRQKDSGIIFAATKKECDKLYEQLKKDGFSVGKYHADMPELAKERTADAFIHDRLKIVVATTAFGMGIDKSDIRYTIHSSMPYTVANYAQEFGRAGRDGKEAEAMIFYKYSDINSQLMFYEKTEQWERLEMFKEVVDIVTSSDCLRTKISKKFGEELENDCAKCSTCDAKEMELESHIKLDGNKFGLNLLKVMDEHRTTLATSIEILSGSKTVNTKNFRKSFGFNTYNKDDKRKNIVIEDLKQMANELVYRGYVDMKPIDNMSHGFTHKISNLGKQALLGKADILISTPNYELPHEINKTQVKRVLKQTMEKIPMKDSTPRKTTKVLRKREITDNPIVEEAKIIEKKPFKDSFDSSKIENNELLNVLKEKRIDIANSLKTDVENLIKVIPTEVLINIANKSPETRNELSKIEGVDSTITRRHSYWIMTAIKEFNEQKLSLDM